MRTQTLALVDGTPDILASLESLFEGGGYDVVFTTLRPDAYVEIKRLRPQRVVLCTALGWRRPSAADDAPTGSSDAPYSSCRCDTAWRMQLWRAAGDGRCPVRRTIHRHR